MRDDDPPRDDRPSPKRAKAWPWLLAFAVVLVLAVRLIPSSPSPPPKPGGAESPAPQSPIETPAAPSLRAIEPPVAVVLTADCATGPSEAAAANAASLTMLAWAPFRGRQETGWETYALRISTEIGTACPPHSPGFAAALARWQDRRRLPANGLMDAETFKAMNNAWSMARPFVVASRGGACPPPPAPDRLVELSPSDIYGKPERAIPDALDAYRRMVADARAADPAIAADPKMLTVFSAYRDPVSDAADCAARGNCGGAEKANCSSHRSGTAFDIVVGAAPGQRIDSSADANRLAMSKTPAYRWLVLNAPRYGFLNYAFEPWHWEWVGAPAP